ncbi:MAG: hypothetical protein AAF205_11705 [Pseudomonadota bacterium]
MRNESIKWDHIPFYPRVSSRAILSGLYSATLIYWLQDDEPNFEATRAFLGRRIDGVMRFEKTKADVQKSFGNLPSLTRLLGRLRYPGN